MGYFPGMFGVVMGWKHVPDKKERKKREQQLAKLNSKKKGKK
jgi:hypothetical protein